ncbi:SPFH domain-containing protein [Candidatus Wolfebacteria bacterium]|nr:SPFH domain-containing protein [Candidatus Wolfebacteria bacterium]
MPDGTPEEVGLVRARYELSEGWSWILPRPIMAAEAVDARERSSRADKFTVISSNNVRITVEPSAIRWRVENPGQVLSVGEEVIDRSLVELVQQNLRSTVRTLNDDDAVAARDLILDGIQRRADQRAIEWGIDVIEVLVGELSRPPEVQEDYEKARREERQREAERIELEHVRERIRELMAAPLNFTPEQALEIVQTERDKVKKTIDEKKVTISSESRGVVSAALTALLGRRP